MNSFSLFILLSLFLYIQTSKVKRFGLNGEIPLKGVAKDDSGLPHYISCKYISQINNSQREIFKYIKSIKDDLSNEMDLHTYMQGGRNVAFIVYGDKNKEKLLEILKRKNVFDEFLINGEHI